MPEQEGDRRRVALRAIWAIFLALVCTMARPDLGEAAPPLIDASVLDPPGDRLFPEGKAIYRQNCAGCHDQGAGRAPLRTLLRFMSPEAIHQALTAGVMRGQGGALTPQQRVDVAQFLSSRKLADAGAASPEPMCKGRAATFDRRQPPAFANWGFDLAGTHSIPAAGAGLTRANVGRLRLQWSFGFVGSERMRSQPALAGGAIFLGSHTGAVYALDRTTGCVRWKFEAPAEVRTAVVVAPWRAGDASANPLLYFGDVRAELYAVEAFTGRLAWKIRADAHPAAVLTAAPSLHAGTLYVSVSSLEENAATTPGYSCCTFRGSVLALDAATGAEKWRTYLVGEPKPLIGARAELFGPSGVAVWNSPAIDPRRGQLTIATGDNYTDPATELSDSIVALDLGTGRIKWQYQATQNDRWNVACILPGNPNCPVDEGPDDDFGAGTMLVAAADGRELVVAGQKSSMIHALDPDSGRPLWQTRVGRGGIGGGINFGIAAAAGRVFAPVSDMSGGKPSPFLPKPGIHALDAATGRELWYAPALGDCHGRPACLSGTSGSVSTTGELVLAGADDGHVRIYDAAGGKVLWDYDTSRDLDTANGVAAHGGAISGGVAPIVDRGQLIVASGYGYGRKMPGNALLVFEVK
ncbi:MAG: PQQ-binding-like beta-propeller repeat protein [Novosphingobium sp.]